MADASFSAWVLGGVGLPLAVLGKMGQSWGNWIEYEFTLGHV